MIYPSNALPQPPICPRCGQEATVQWVEVTTFGQPIPHYMPGVTYCQTIDCIDEKGRNAVRWPDDRCDTPNDAT